MKPVVLVLASLLSVPSLPSLADPVWLHYRNREVSDVFVAGEFNNWDKTADRLTQGEDGLWTLEKDLPAGTYGYKLVVDENWIFDPENPARKEVGGVENSMLDTADPFFSKPVDLSVSRTWTSRSGAQLGSPAVSTSRVSRSSKARSSSSSAAVESPRAASTIARLVGGT